MAKSRMEEYLEDRGQPYEPKPTSQRQDDTSFVKNINKGLWSLGKYFTTDYYKDYANRYDSREAEFKQLQEKYGKKLLPWQEGYKESREAWHKMDKVKKADRRKFLKNVTKDVAKYMWEPAQTAVKSTWQSGKNLISGKPFGAEGGWGDLGDVDTFMKMTQHVPEDIAEGWNKYSPDKYDLEETGHKTGLYDNPYYDEEMAKKVNSSMKDLNNFYFGEKADFSQLWDSRGFKEWQRATGNTDWDIERAVKSAADKWAANNPIHEWVGSNIVNPSQYSSDELLDKYNIMYRNAANEAAVKYQNDYIDYADERVGVEATQKTGVDVTGYKNLLEGMGKMDQGLPMDEVFKDVNLGMFENWKTSPEWMKTDHTYTGDYAQSLYADPRTQILTELPLWVLGTRGIGTLLRSPAYLAKFGKHGAKGAKLGRWAELGIGNLFPATTEAYSRAPGMLGSLINWPRSMGAQFIAPTYYGHKSLHSGE